MLLVVVFSNQQRRVLMPLSVVFFVVVGWLVDWFGTGRDRRHPRGWGADRAMDKYLTYHRVGIIQTRLNLYTDLIFDGDCKDKYASGL